MGFSFTPSPPPDKRRKPRKRKWMYDPIMLALAGAVLTTAVILLVASSLAH